MAKHVKKVVLAYSGGLDTSVMIPWLKENYGCEVVAFAADVGQGEELEPLREKAIKTGASQIFIEDCREEFAREYCFRALKADAVYEQKYLLATSLARPIIAKKQMEIAAKVGADAVSHGATGKGNDQVRFELTYKSINPNLKIIAPWREWELKSRTDEYNYAKARGIPVPGSIEKPYSSDRNLWHISFEGGVLEDPANPPDPDMFILTVSPEAAPDKPAEVEIGFEQGVPVSLNGAKKNPLALVDELTAIGGAHGIGRVDIVENRLVGMKSRGVYECPAATILYAAHRELMSLTLDRETYHYRQAMAVKYGEMVYYGQWFVPLREALDAFIDSTEKVVSGTVRLKLYKGNIEILARKSPNSLYDAAFSTFEEDRVYNQADAEGFINLFGLPITIQARLRKKTKV